MTRKNIKEVHKLKKASVLKCPSSQKDTRKSLKNKKIPPPQKKLKRKKKERTQTHKVKEKTQQQQKQIAHLMKQKHKKLEEAA